MTGHRDQRGLTISRVWLIDGGGVYGNGGSSRSASSRILHHKVEVAGAVATGRSGVGERVENSLPRGKMVGGEDGVNGVSLSGNDFLGL